MIPEVCKLLGTFLWRWQYWERRDSTVFCGWECTPKVGLNPCKQWSWILIKYAGAQKAVRVQVVFVRDWANCSFDSFSFDTAAEEGEIPELYDLLNLRHSTYALPFPLVLTSLWRKKPTRLTDKRASMSLQYGKRLSVARPCSPRCSHSKKATS